MLETDFQQWIPTERLASHYDVESISVGERLSITLVADQSRTPQDCIQRFCLTWASSEVISYTLTDETYRADCWDLDFENDGRFYLSRRSAYIDAFRQKSPLFPEHALHFLIVGTNTVAEVLAIAPPSVQVPE